MAIELECQVACDDNALPSHQMIKRWVLATLPADCKEATLCIRMINESESAELNTRYRHKQGATNVLAFSYDSDPLSGDLAICATIVAREAEQAAISNEEHWAHIVIHGILHLLGHDHEKVDQAEKMEGQESKIMLHLGYKDPYR